MTHHTSTLTAAILLSLSGSISLAQSDQDAIDACIDALMASGNDGALGGTVLQSSFSEAGTLVLLEDANSTVWRCVAYSDGSVGVLEEATDEEVQNARSAPSPGDFQEQVQFEAGANSAVLNRTIEAGGAFQFVLGAGEGQFLSVSIVPGSGEMYYVIRNPDGSILLDGTDAATEYYGQLWQSGDHIVEVVNQTSEPLTYEIAFRIE